MGNAIYRIFADFNCCDAQGRARFTDGTYADVKRLNIELKPGLKVILDDDDEFEIEAVIEFSEEDNDWVARFEWERLKSKLD